MALHPKHSPREMFYFKKKSRPMRIRNKTIPGRQFASDLETLEAAKVYLDIIIILKNHGICYSNFSSFPTDDDDNDVTLVYLTLLDMESVAISLTLQRIKKERKNKHTGRINE